jgi:release factor glutamine methyltransferase
MRSPPSTRPSSWRCSPKKPPERRTGAFVTVLEALRVPGIEAREARLLLAHVLHANEAQILGFPEKEISESGHDRFLDCVRRRQGGEPLAYLVGEKEFYGLALEVTPAVLIPRPETELLVELALERSFSSLADLGTGSGAVALAVKERRPKARVVAVELSAAALEVARRNAARHRLAVDFRQGSWLAPLANERFGVIAANPPYVAAGDPHLADLRFEPQAALVSGADGLDAIRDIVRAAPAHLVAGGWLLLEHGLGQDAAVRELLERAGLEDAQTWPDLAGIPRVSGARR